MIHDAQVVDIVKLKGMAAKAGNKAKERIAANRANAKASTENGPRVQWQCGLATLWLLT